MDIHYYFNKKLGIINYGANQKIKHINVCIKSINVFNNVVFVSRNYQIRTI